MKTFKDWLQEWANPAVLMSLALLVVGGVIWGNNLTEEALRAAEERGALVESDKQINKRVAGAYDRHFQTDAKNQAAHASMAAVLDGLLRTVDSLERRMQRNEGDIRDNQGGHREQ